METLETVKVAVVIDPVVNIVPCSNTFTAEELCIFLCKKYNISPLTRTLFSLRIRGTDYFLKDNSIVLFSSRDYELRIRYKIPKIHHLITLDEYTYDYYFQQARDDVNDNKVPEIKYAEHKKELLGLGITDMYRAIIEEKLCLADVEKNYKKYIPKEVIKRHQFFTKKPVHSTLQQIVANKIGYDVNFVKSQYLQQLYLMAPNYLAEEYRDVQWKIGSELVPVRLQVVPFHELQPGLRLFNTIRRKWIHVCTIEELIYITRNGNNAVEISRRGTPLFFTFISEQQLSSFISVCDGYYRLMVKWTFNLSKDDESPSLKELYRIKCHGPVGGAFSYRKLEEKCSKKHGCYILRQCQDDYNVFYLDVCTKNRTTETYRIEYKGRCYIFNNEEYFSIDRLVACHQNPEGRIFLNECIPPSEYDKSQLLLCGEPQKKGVRIDQSELQEILKDNKSPRCLSTKDILLYTSSEKIGFGGITATYKALWKLDETKKVEIAFKALQRDKCNDYLKDFIELANNWACVQSSSIVRLYGITLSSRIALVMEYLPYGPFDVYLRENIDKMKPIHLKKVAAGLARALWDLSEAGCVHGYIRCRRLFLSLHEGDRIIVKLSGPSLHVYAPDDVHWIPVEFFSEMTLAKRFIAGDVWAFATTLWEIFSYGQSPNDSNPVLTAKSYEMGDRLLRPAKCPSEVWALIRQCWQPDPHLRARPQEIMRDMNHLLSREYIPVHEYEEPKISLDLDHMNSVSSDRFIPSEVSDVASSKSLISVESSLPSVNGTLSDQYDNPFADNRSSNSLDSINALDCLMLNNSTACTQSIFPEYGPSRPESPDECGACAAPRLMESIVSHGKTYLVTLSKRIGSGNYGHVFKGWMERDNQESQRKEVAIKKLTRHESEQNSNLYEDFRKEIEIMKSLQHVNIVEILGYSVDQDVLIVMEYLEEGSLNYYLKFQGDKLRLSHLLKYTLDIATGMDHVSAKNVVHRDLATRNILVVNKHHVKISDFGLARIIPKEENAYRLKTERLLPINWYAPESAVKPWNFSTKSDVWSYGVTAWEIFTRAREEVPKFDTEKPRERASCFPIPQDCPSEVFRHLMKDCWDLDPNKRPKFIDLVLMCKRFIAEYK